MPAPVHYDPDARSEEPLLPVNVGVRRMVGPLVFYPPRTRRGFGPGIITLQSPTPAGINQRDEKAIDPTVPIKLAEEGYGVVAIDFQDLVTLEMAVRIGLEALFKADEVDQKEKFAILIYSNQEVFDRVLDLLPKYPKICCVVAYDCTTDSSPVPLLVHMTAPGPAPKSTKDSITSHIYAGARPLFYEPHLETYKAGPATLSYTRTVEFLRKHLGGPYFDLEAIWDEHCLYEFEQRSLAKTMGTMVEEPYVNHIPTMTGGIGRENLTAFYRDHFIFKNPADSALELVSRTVGIDRIIDEFVFHLTHDSHVDWLLPGVPPTGKKLAIPMMAAVHIRGDRLAHEHIWWDQAGALLQAGLLPERVPLPGGHAGETLRLPVAGVEATRLVLDNTDGISNAMLTANWR